MKKGVLVIFFVLGVITLFNVVSAFQGVSETGAPIYKGWNLVYGFYTPEQLSGSQLVSNNIKAIYGFVPTTQKYIQVYPNKYEDITAELSQKHNYDDEELIMTAFWVYSDKTVEGSLNGKSHYEEYWLDHTPLHYTERPLYKGWNFFGVTPDILGKNMDDINGDCNIEKIYNWDAESQQWSSGLVGATVGSGVLIKVSSNCEFAEPGEPNITPPPAVPN